MLSNETNIKYEATTPSISDIAIQLEEPHEIWRRATVCPPLPQETLFLAWLCLWY